MVSTDGKRLVAFGPIARSVRETQARASHERQCGWAHQLALLGPRGAPSRLFFAQRPDERESRVLVVVVASESFVSRLVDVAQTTVEARAELGGSR